MALPTLTVLLDDGTDTFPLNVTSRVLATDGYSVTRGRSDWEGAVTAGELRLTFNNSDGYFTAGAGSAFVDQKIRIKETVNGAVYTRFTGYVKSWPVSWPAVVVTFSTVSPTATDAQARAERTTLRSMLEEEIMLRSPEVYYLLSEPTGSTSAGDTSGNQAAPLTIAGTGTALTFGTGTGPVDGKSATQFFGGEYLQGGTGDAITPPTTYTIVSAFAYTSVGGTFFDHNGWLISGNVSGQIIASGPGFLSLVTSLGAPSYADGLTHVAVLTGDGATATLYVDGVSAATSAIGAVSSDIDLTTVGFASTATSVTVSHDAAFSTAFTLADAQAICGVGRSTLTESGTARITRLAGYADIPVGTLDTSMTTVPAQATLDVSAFTAIQDVADAEGGVVFVDGSGNLTFHNRSRPSVKTTPDLTLDRQWVTPEVQPVLDDQQLVNYFEATASATGSAQLARDLTSEAAHGRYPDSKTYLVTTDQEALDRANWAVEKLSEPISRYGTLTINLFGMTASQASTVLAALELNCWLRVTSMASQTPGGTTVDVVVEGWQEQVTAESWSITCNVVAQSLFVAGIYNNAALGVYNTSVYAY